MAMEPCMEWMGGGRIRVSHSALAVVERMGMWWPRNNLPCLRYRKNLRSKPRLARGDIWLTHTDIETLRGRGRGTAEVVVLYKGRDASAFASPMTLTMVPW